MLEVILISVGLLIVAVAGFGIKMLFDRNGEFAGSSCQVHSEELQEKGIGSCCGGTCSTQEN